MKWEGEEAWEKKGSDLLCSLKGGSGSGEGQLGLPGTRAVPAAWLGDSEGSRRFLPPAAPFARSWECRVTWDLVYGAVSRGTGMLAMG